ncbi:hypothetical protein [Caproiciproducens sp. LBM24188]|nr:hypothetical protein [Oscillospiraceae bacterium]HHV32368.1 hypothetical protein [Clostridiales bacterium]
MSKNIKEEISREIDRRIHLLKEHQGAEIIVTGNQYEELNQALSKVIGAPLIGELQSLKEYVNRL